MDDEPGRQVEAFGQLGLPGAASCIADDLEEKILDSKTLTVGDAANVSPRPTFEFEQLVPQLRPGQLVDSVRHRVLVI